MSFNTKRHTRVIQDSPFGKITIKGYLTPNLIQKSYKNNSKNIAGDIYHGSAAGIRIGTFNHSDIKNVHFMGSFFHTSDLPALGLAEICLLGPSNVGKSSFINSMLNYAIGTRDNVAYVSKTPGYTKSINLFKLTDAKDTGVVTLVDLPGYGDTALKDPIKLKMMRSFLSAYIKRRNELKLILFLVDINGLSDNDIKVKELLNSQSIPHLIVATKVDKIPPTKIPGALLSIRKALNIESPLPILHSKYAPGNLNSIWKAASLAADDSFDQSKLGLYDNYQIAQNDKSMEIFTQNHSKSSLKELKRIILNNYILLPESARGINLDSLDRHGLLGLLNTILAKASTLPIKSIVY